MRDDYLQWFMVQTLNFSCIKGIYSVYPQTRDTLQKIGKMEFGGARMGENEGDGQEGKRT